MSGRDVSTLKVGITGGIGTGKTLVCKVFSTLAIPIYNADSRAKWLMNNDTNLKSNIVQLIGKEAYNKQDNLDSKFIASIVLKDETLLQKLNQLVHPKVGEDFENWVSMQFHVPFVLKEAALLFEAGSYKLLDYVITVTSPLELRIKRIQLRDPFRSVDQIKEIIKNQWSEEQKIRLSDEVIINDETMLLIPQILKVYRQLLAK